MKKTVSKAVGKKHLLKLADFLEALPRKRFDYSRWVGADWKGAPDLSCGTVACAAGWATTIPSFRRAGLHLRRHRNGSVSPALGDKVSIEALGEFFGIARDQARLLFVPLENNLGMNPTPKQVARHIRKFVKEWE